VLSLIGTYKDISVVTLYSRVLVDQVIVACFKEAFSLDIYQNDALMDKKLHLQIKQLSSEDIEKEFNKDPAYWLKDEKEFILTEEQAKIRISTSLYLEIWSRARFNITKQQAIKIFKVNI